MMGFAYSTDGRAFRAWDDPESLSTGEVYFAAAPTGVQLAAAFPNYTAAQLGTAAAQAAVTGVTVTLSGSVTLAPTLFPTDAATQAKLGAVVTTLIATGAFPGGALSYPLKDSAGAWHTLTISQYKAVAGAIAGFVAANILIADGNPNGATALPTASLSLAV